MTHRVSKVSCALIAAAGACVAPAIGGLQESNVLLLYNSQVSDSLAIRNAYVTAHPGVLEYDLNMAYPVITSATRSATPPTGGINSQFITPEAFIDIFIDPGPFRTFLANNPGIYAIVTTYGLPGAISENFDPDPVVGFLPGGGIDRDGIIAAFERGFMSLAVDGSGEIIFDNPYADIPVPIDEYMALCSGAGFDGLGPGDFYLATRLDAGHKVFNCSGEPTYPTKLNGVLDLISRSANLPPVNKFAVNSIFDSITAASTSGDSVMRQAISRMWDSRWPVVEEYTDEVFLHGPLDPQFQSPEDDATDDYPTLVLMTLGRNHPKTPGCSTCDTIGRCYTRYYNADPSGLFVSFESFNGWRVHSQHDNDNSAQGDILDWISVGEGSFAMGYIAEPLAAGAASSPNRERLLEVLYNRGLTWAEASAASNPTKLVTVIGDPLATVTVYDPDVDEDGAIEFDDLNAVIGAKVTQDLAYDIDGDGDVDDDDEDLVSAVYGRSRGAQPTGYGAMLFWHLPWHNAGNTIYGRCYGDANGDLVVDFDDLQLVLTSYASDSCPDLLYLADLNNDGVVDDDDRDIVLANFGLKRGDFDGDGDMDGDDFALLCAHLFTVDPSLISDCGILPPPYTCVGWDPLYNFLCIEGGAITCLYIDYFLNAVPGAGTCPSCP